MGQPKVASVTWRDRIRRISQGFYETMGQQIPQTRASEPMRAWSHVKILNRDLRSTVIFLRKSKGIGQTFRLRGRHCFVFMGFEEFLLWRAWFCTQEISAGSRGDRVATSAEKRP